MVEFLGLAIVGSLFFGMVTYMMCQLVEEYMYLDNLEEAE